MRILDGIQMTRKKKKIRKMSISLPKCEQNTGDCTYISYYITVRFKYLPKGSNSELLENLILNRMIELLTKSK